MISYLISDSYLISFSDFLTPTYIVCGLGERWVRLWVWLIQRSNKFAFHDFLVLRWTWKANEKNSVFVAVSLLQLHGCWNGLPRPVCCVLTVVTSLVMLSLAKCCSGAFYDMRNDKVDVNSQRSEIMPHLLVSNAIHQRYLQTSRAGSC